MHPSTLFRYYLRFLDIKKKKRDQTELQFHMSVLNCEILVYQKYALLVIAVLRMPAVRKRT
jgi:hypothetical protein